MGLHNAELLIVLITVLGSFIASGNEDSNNVDRTEEAIALKDEVVWTDLNRSASLLCHAPSVVEVLKCTLSHSLFEIPGEATINVTLPDEEHLLPIGFYSSEKGLQNGECLVTVQNVSHTDFGFWNYSLITAQQTFVCSIRLERWVKPLFKPSLKDRETLNNLLDLNMRAENFPNNKRNLTCCTPNGIPDVSLFFQIGKRRIQSWDNNIQNYTEDNNQVCIKWTNATFQARDNGKKLICGADHVSFGGEELHEDFVALNIEYDPRWRNLSNGTTMVIFVTKQTLTWDLTVTAEGNPAPHLDVDLVFQNGSVVPFDQSIGKLNALIAASGPENSHLFETTTATTLQIFNVQRLVEEKITLSFRATNAHGRAFINFRFEHEYSGSLEKLLIILAIAFALVLAAVLSIIITLRSSRRCEAAAPAGASGRVENRSCRKKGPLPADVPEEAPCLVPQKEPGSVETIKILKHAETSV